MTVEWVWVIDCPIHDFHCDNIKKSIVNRKVDHHVRSTGCCEVCKDDIKRVPAPTDTDFRPVKPPKFMTYRKIELD
jgi:hypothetical protein